MEGKLSFEGKFEPLKDYFADLTVEDVARLNDYEIIQAAEPRHRLLMTVFVRNVLRPLQQRPSCEVRPVRAASDEVCALQGLLCSTSMRKAHLVPCDGVKTFVRAKYPEARLQTMRVLDATQNGLQACDLSHIAAFS